MAIGIELRALVDVSQFVWVRYWKWWVEHFKPCNLACMCSCIDPNEFTVTFGQQMLKSPLADLIA